MVKNSSDRYKNKYRILSNRRKEWNYAQNGRYFITIVTKDRQQIFGKIVDGQMILNDIGKIVNAEFLKSFEMRDELYLDEYVIMPNHIHAILILDNDHTVNDNVVVETHGRASLQLGRASLRGIAHREPKSISSFVAGFKSSSTNRIDDWIDGHDVETHGRASLQMNRASLQQKFNKTNPLWQANYYDHIIRNEMEYHQIVEYIKNNPLKWDDDSLSNDERNEWEE